MAGVAWSTEQKARLIELVSETPPKTLKGWEGIAEQLAEIRPGVTGTAVRNVWSRLNRVQPISTESNSVLPLDSKELPQQEQTVSQLSSTEILPSSTQIQHISTQSILSLTADQVLKKTGEILETIEIAEREWTGRGKKGTQNLVLIGGKLPPDIVEEVRALKGPVTHHLERALRLYLKVLKATEGK